ncbi:hypothetical protein GE09DRAFT_12873 [Coniochaeta sp. 2T2.1]|nr:hypothetical protein GE09DRAFT_12873 [Coniochaeta sp. 2T2.1]
MYMAALDSPKLHLKFSSKVDHSPGAERSKRELQSKMKTMTAHAFAESINLGVTALAFWYGGKLLSEGLYDTRTFFIVFMAVLTRSNTGGVLFGFSSNVAKAHSAANHILDLRASQPPINTSTGVEALAASDEPVAVEFCNVTFTYPGDPTTRH